MTHKTLDEMTPDELAGALQEAEAIRQEARYQRGPEGSYTRAWARDRKAAIRGEYRRRGLAAPRGRSFASWAGVGAS